MSKTVFHFYEQYKKHIYLKMLVKLELCAAHGWNCPAIYEKFSI